MSQAEPRNGAPSDWRARSSRLGDAVPGSSFWARTGLLLAGSSFLLWGFLPLVPFLPFDGDTRVAIGGTVFVLMEVAWWGGLAMAGPAATRKLRRWWRGRADDEPAEDAAEVAARDGDAHEENRDD